jgi:hypothetical protein
MMDVSGIQSKMACITLFDATILFDSFTHIYLVFCPCFIYKMPWYFLFYVLKVILDVRFKKE